MEISPPPKKRQIINQEGKTFINQEGRQIINREGEIGKKKKIIKPEGRITNKMEVN